MSFLRENGCKKKTTGYAGGLGSNPVTLTKKWYEWGIEKPKRRDIP